MGEVKEESVSESESPNLKGKPQLFAAIMLIIGLFSPVLISVYNYTMEPQVLIQGMFWIYSQSSGWYDNGFSIVPPYSMISALPFLLLRMAPVSQIYRYYNGKTTRKRVFITSIIGDGYYLISAIVILIITFGYDTYHIPLTFQIIFSFFVLLKFRILEPTTPWKSEDKPKSWWAKTPDSQEKKSTDDDDKLW
ncbi:MAG: hypothetical protein RTV31_05995 [Candidatus Thorarchaeota archaeon]